MSGTNQFWTGDGGNAYTARNRVDWRARVPFWCDVLAMTGARSAYEVGCNAAWNLSALQCADSLMALRGCEVNDRAARQAQAAGFKVATGTALECLHFADDEYELVFTAGVLIHVPPDELHETMRAIIKASADYVLAVEYAADVEEEIEYRGRRGLLWKRPYGRLYEDMGLTPVRQWGAPGFDRCTAWLLRK